MDMQGSGIIWGYLVIEGNIFELEDYIVSVEAVEEAVNLILTLKGQ